MVVVLSALLVAAAVAWAGWQIAGRLAIHPEDRGEIVKLMTLFAPGLSEAARDPRALLIWQPLAMAARTLFPEEFAALDRATGSRFPFSPVQIENAHARWTADWLEWERQHDSEYKRKALALQEGLGDRRLTADGRAQLEAVEREKLETYQRRYEEYVRVGKALQALLRSPS